MDGSSRGAKMRATSVVLNAAAGLVLLLAGAAGAEESSPRGQRNWPMYGGNLSHTFSNDRSLITPARYWPAATPLMGPVRT